jgi:hypothetical protein
MRGQTPEIFPLIYFRFLNYLNSYHECFFSRKHSRISATMIKPTMMIHGVVEPGFSLGDDAAGIASSVFFGAVGCTIGTCWGFTSSGLT